MWQIWKTWNKNKSQNLPCVGPEVDPSIETPTEDLGLGQVISEFYVPLHCSLATLQHCASQGSPGWVINRLHIVKTADDQIMGSLKASRRVRIDHTNRVTLGFQASRWPLFNDQASRNMSSSTHKYHTVERSYADPCSSSEMWDLQRCHHPYRQHHHLDQWIEEISSTYRMRKSNAVERSHNDPRWSL